MTNLSEVADIRDEMDFSDWWMTANNGKPLFPEDETVKAHLQFRASLFTRLIEIQLLCYHKEES